MASATPRKLPSVNSSVWLTLAAMDVGTSPRNDCAGAVLAGAFDAVPLCPSETPVSEPSKQISSKRFLMAPSGVTATGLLRRMFEGTTTNIAEAIVISVKCLVPAAAASRARLAHVLAMRDWHHSNPLCSGEEWDRSPVS